MGLWTLWVTGTLSIKSTGQNHDAGRIFHPQIRRKTLFLKRTASAQNPDDACKDRPTVANGAELSAEAW
jgi:hypothetical protein